METIRRELWFLLGWFLNLFPSKSEFSVLLAPVHSHGYFKQRKFSLTMDLTPIIFYLCVVVLSEWVWNHQVKPVITLLELQELSFNGWIFVSMNMVWCHIRWLGKKKIIIKIVIAISLKHCEIIWNKHFNWSFHRIFRPTDRQTIATWSHKYSKSLNKMRYLNGKSSK